MYSVDGQTTSKGEECLSKERLLRLLHDGRQGVQIVLDARDPAIDVGERRANRGRLERHCDRRRLCRGYKGLGPLLKLKRGDTQICHLSHHWGGEVVGGGVLVGAGRLRAAEPLTFGPCRASPIILAVPRPRKPLVSSGGKQGEEVGAP